MPAKRIQDEITKVRASRLKLLFDTLTAAGITGVTVEFDGCGDSGQIEETTVEPEGTELPVHVIHWLEGRCEYVIADAPPTPATNAAETLERMRKWTFDPKPGTVNDLLESIVYDYMEKEHAGWENNDGAFGNFQFNVSKRTVQYNHNERFTDSSLTTHDYKAED